MALTKVTGSVIKDSVSLSGNVSVGGTLTYQDVTNVDALGIGTFRTGIKVLAGQVDVGSNIKLGNAGVITATSFVGSGANLTSLPTQLTLSNNADNRVITGGSGTNLVGEANFIAHAPSSGVGYVELKHGGSSGDYGYYQIRSGSTLRGRLGSNYNVDAISLDTAGGSSTAMIFKTGSSQTERLRIFSDGKFGFGTGNSLSETTIAEFSSSVGGGAIGANITIRNSSTNSVNNVAELRLKTAHGVARFYKYNTGSTVIQSHTSGASDLLLYADGASNLRLHTNASERLRIDSDGRMMIGTTTPGNSTADDLTIANATNAGITIRGATNGECNIFFGDGTSGGDQYRGMVRYYHSNDALAFHAAGAERARIASDGKLSIDRTHASATTGNHPALDIDTYANGTAGATFATGIDFRVAGVHKKRLVVTNVDSSAGTGDWIFYRDQGNNVGLKISSAGQVTKPYQYMFTVETNSTSKTANWSKITGLTPDANQCTGVSDGTNWSNSTQRFTAPVAGVYYFFVGGWAVSASNGSRYAYTFKHTNGNYYNYIGGGNYCLVDSPMDGFSRTIKLSAGEWVELWGFSSVATTWGGGHRFFWGGYLLG